MKTNKFSKIVATLFIVFLIASLTACVFTACNDTQNQKQVPVYNGMVISSRFARASASAVPADDNENHYGHYKGDHEHRDGDVDGNKPFDNKTPSIEDKAQSTLDVVGAGQNIYYAAAGQDIFITIKLSNPDSYEILSFTLNGKKYSNYMFEQGSDMENLVLKVNVGYVGGIHDYTIDAIKYVDGTDIKDVRMDGERTVKAGVRAYDQTYASVTNEKKSMTSISFDVQVVDLYSLIQMSGGYAKAVLYDGVNMISKDITVGEKTSVTFDNLTPNTIYQYGVVALYDDLSGNGINLNTLYKKAVYTDTIVLFKDIEVGQETLSWGYLWNNAVENKTITSLELMQKGTKIKDVEATATSIDGLKTDNEYTLKATYKNLKNQDESIQITFKTLAKAVPSVEIVNVVSTQTSVDFAINVTDADNVGAIAKIELLHGEDAPIVVANTDRTIANLLSDNDYTIKITYAYDLNDGVGNQNIVKTADFKTLAKAVPSVRISNIASTQNKLSADVTYTDVDGVGRIESIALFKGETQVATTSERTHVVFDTLENDTEYTLVVTYKYDLNDGKGEQSDTQSAKRYTAPRFEFVEATCANTSAVSKGEVIYFEAKVVNPSGVAIERIKINDKYYAPSSGTTKTSIIVNITVEDQFEGGNTALEVTEIEGTLRGQKVSIVPSQSNVANVFVNGELTAKSIKIVDEDGKECDFVVAGKQYYYIVSFGNKTGYSIDSITINSRKFSLAQGDYTMQDAETAKIPIAFSTGWRYVSLTGAEYSNSSLGEKSKDIVGVKASTLCVTSEVPIVVTTAEQLKSMNGWGYYVLENDIDLAGAEWKDPADFYGYFDGQGYTIKNMNFVGTVENASFSWGLFDSAGGVIKNLTLNGRLIVTMNSTDEKSYAARVGGLCADSGTLVIENVANNVNLAVTNSGDTYAGGLVGYVNGTVTITDSYNTGAVTGCFVGGLVGYAYYGSTVTITNSYNTGGVTATATSSDYSYAGGLVGCNGTVTITNSYNTGGVTATATSSRGSYAGGLVGYAYSTVTITDSYNTGDVTGRFVGGLVGYVDLSGTVTITNSYYTLPETSRNDYGEKKSSVAEIVAIIKDLWDSTVWDFDNLDDNGNPTLKI